MSFIVLDSLIRSLRDFGQVGEDAAPAVARVLLNDIKTDADAGRSPEGKPWEKTLAGRKALPRAASAVKVSFSSNRIRVSLSDIHARHHFGWVRGGKRRQILPTGGLKSATVAQITEIMLQTAARHVNG